MMPYSFFFSFLQGNFYLSLLDYVKNVFIKFLPPLAFLHMRCDSRLRNFFLSVGLKQGDKET